MEKIKFNRAQFSSCLQKTLNSPAVIALLAVMCVLSNILGWEMPVYIASCVIWIFICLFGKDFLALSSFCLLYFSPSTINNPGRNPKSIFFTENGPYLYIIIAMIAIGVVCAVVSVAVKHGKQFFTAERKQLPFLALFCLACFLGGVGQESYTFLNFRYVAVFSLSLLLLYYILTGTVNWKEVNRDYLFYLGTFGGLVVAAELLYIYASSENIVSESGVLNTSLLFTGWGHYNNMGGMLAMFLSAPFYFAATKKYGIPFFFVGIFLYICIILTNSRGSILVGTVILLAVFVYLVCHRRNRMINIVCIAVTVIGLGVFVLADFENIKVFFTRIFQKKMESDSRLEIYKLGWQQFLQNPILGNSFYSCTTFQWATVSDMTLLPPRWHNTVVQLLASCGIVGLVCYLLHRGQTVWLVFKGGVTPYKLFLFASILSLVGVSLVDCHLFNLGPGLVYSVYLAFLDKADITPNSKEELQDKQWKEYKKALKKSRSFSVKNSGFRG